MSAAIQSTLQLVLQRARVLHLLRTRIFRTMLPVSLGDWHDIDLARSRGLHGNLRISYSLTEHSNLVQDHLAHLWNVFHDLKVKVECCRTVWLVGCIMPDGEVRMLESLLDRDSFARIEGQHAVQEVQGVLVGIGE